MEAIKELVVEYGVAKFVLPGQRESGGRKGLGIIAMQERVTAIGGTLRIQSMVRNRAELSLQILLEDEHANSHRTRG